MEVSRADAVYRQTERRLFALRSGDDAMIRGRLANLRRGAGRKPGDDPQLWGLIFEDLPDYMEGRGGAPSREEWAIHIALTLYAVHQQGNDPKTHNMDVDKVSLGAAAAKLVAAYGGEDARERVSRRFNQLALAQDIDSMAYYLRGFVQLLRAEDIGLDYAVLARDLYVYQTADGAASVRLRWGEDYYRTNNDDAENGKEDVK